MSSISDMIDGVKRADALLSDSTLEPNADRADWISAKKKIDELRTTLSEEIEPRFRDAIAEAEDTELAPLIRRRTAALYADAAAVLQASGDGLHASELLRKAESFAADDEQRADLVAAQKEPAVFARLTLSLWFLSEGRFDEADKAAKRVRRETKQPLLDARAKKILAGPRPLRGGPPSLFTLNGFGTGLYGSRDHDAEGSYVATYCICLLFIPVFPLAAYRVTRVDSRTYRFFAKERLSSFARGVQALLGIGALCAVTGLAVNSWLDSPDHKAEVAIEAARAVEKKGDEGAAIEAYAKVAQDFPPTATGVREAADAIARLAAKRLPSPCTVDSLEAVRREAGAFASLRGDVRAGATGTPLAKRLDACATEIGDADDSHARAALRVLDLAGETAEGSPDATWVDERRRTARRAFAVRSAETRPLVALGELAKLSDRESVAAAKKIMLGLGDDALWIEARADILRWTKNARKTGDVDGASDAVARIAAATASQKASEDLLAGGDEKAIAKAAADHPKDQTIAVALAAQRRSRGDHKGAIEVLSKLGAPGRLTADAQELLANAHGDAGDLVKADAILTALVDERLPAFQDAQRAYETIAEATQRKITANLQLDIVPPDLQRRLTGITDEDKKRDVFQAWLGEKMESDPDLAGVRSEYLMRGAAVPASLALGMIKLQRAASASGDERKALLDQAERSFLAIRNEAAGDPRFHLALAQVYHRLGKTEEGEKEMASVLERKDPALELRVADTYRSLGLHSRARQVARAVYDRSTADAPVRYEAAQSLSVLVTELDEEEDWLRRSDPDSPVVRNSLAHVQGERLLRDGKAAEADQKFKQCVEFHARTAKTRAVSANNAATATMYRYTATGDPAHLRAAAAYLEDAVRLEPDQALILGNLAGVLMEIGYVSMLDKWIDTRTLALDPGDVRTLARSVLDGPLAPEAVEALRKDASFQRSLEVSRKLQVLAPQMRSAYRIPIAWFDVTRDVKALEELDKRLEMLPGSSDADADLRAKWLSGEQDESTLRDANADIAKARRTFDRAKNGSRATQAAAWLVLAGALEGPLLFKRDPASMSEMVDAARKAHAGWPEGITRGAVSSVLFSVAFYRAMEGSPALAKAWEAERRTYSLFNLAYRAASGPSAAEITAALRKEPLVAEAAAVRKQGAADRPTVGDYLLARLAGDAELEQLATKTFDSRNEALTDAIEAKLAPNDKDAVFTLAVFRGHGKAP